MLTRVVDYRRSCRDQVQMAGLRLALEFRWKSASSDEPIPIHFAYLRDINVAADFSEGDQSLRDFFDTPPNVSAAVVPSGRQHRVTARGHTRDDRFLGG